MNTEDPKTEDINKENSCPQTPIKLERLVFIAGKYRLIPITLEEALSKSAKRVKVLPNGKRVYDTTSLEEKLKRLYQTEQKPKLSEIEDSISKGLKGKNLLTEITEAQEPVPKNSQSKNCVTEIPESSCAQPNLQKRKIPLYGSKSAKKLKKV